MGGGQQGIASDLAEIGAEGVQVAEPLGLFGPKGGLFFYLEVLGGFGEQLGIVEVEVIVDRGLGKTVLALRHVCVRPSL